MGKAIVTITIILVFISCFSGGTAEEGCQAEWVKLGSICYILEMSYTTTWDGADTACKGSGTILAEPTTEAENDRILAYLNANVCGEGVWLGLKRSSGDEFRFQSNQGLTYSAWNAGQPDNNMNKEDCVQYTCSTEGRYLWSDKDCIGMGWFLCQEGSATVIEENQLSPSNGKSKAHCPFFWTPLLLLSITLGVLLSLRMPKA